MSIWNSVYDWFKGKSEIENPTRQEPRRPRSIDWTDSLQVNSVLTKGLYHNSYPGMKLAGSMCFTPIAVPVWFMGLPIPKTKDEDEELQELLIMILEQNAKTMQQLHLQIHRDGTWWVWPHYSAKEQMVIWEIIQDDTICDIVRDINTRKIIRIITDEEITVTTGYNTTAIVRRRRTFSKTKIEVKWESLTAMPEELKDKTKRNVLGILPIPFANNSDADEVRGHSDYERIVTDLKDYHDIDLKRSNLLAKFDVKMVQEIQNLKKWMSNNGYTSISDIDISTMDLIFNLYDQERTTFVFPDRAHEAYNSALRNKFRKIVEGSGIPEILWGTKVTGNLASADLQVDLVVKLVTDKRNQKNESYKKLFEASLKLELLARMNQKSFEDIDLLIEWNSLDAISEETKSNIFKNMAQGVSFLINSAGATKEQLHKIWKSVYPNITEEELTDFEKGLDLTAKHKQFKDTPFELVADLAGTTELD